jgi:hypothetical protein
MLGQLLKRIPKLQRKTAYVIMNCSSKSHGSCSEPLDQMKQAKLQWLQEPSQINGDSLKNVKCKTGDISDTKWRNIWKTKLIRLKRTAKTRTLQTYIKEWRITNHELGEGWEWWLLAYSRIILNMWKNYLSQPFNVDRVGDRNTDSWAINIWA